MTAMGENRPTPDLPIVSDVLGSAIAEKAAMPILGNLTAFIIPRPGEILTIADHRRVYEALVPVTTQSFGADMTPYWALRSREGYLERLAEFIIIGDESGHMVGWTGFHRLSFGDYTTIYIDSTGMIPGRQSRGVMRELLRARIKETALTAFPPDHPVYLTARSESPVFYRLMRGLLGGAPLFPQPGTAVSADIGQCAADLATWLGQSAILDPATLMLNGAYDSLDALYGELPTTGDAELDAMFRRQLGPLDAYLLVGRAEPADFGDCGK